MNLTIVNKLVSIARHTRCARDIANATVAMAKFGGCSYEAAANVLYNKTGLSAPRELSSEKYLPTWFTSTNNEVLSEVWFDRKGNPCDPPREKTKPAATPSVRVSVTDLKSVDFGL